MRRFQHVKDGRIIKVLEVFEKSGAILVEFEDGSTTNYSPSTIKRWWKELPEEEEVAGDGTPYKEVMQEILQDEKKAVEKATEKKTVKKAAEKKPEKTGTKKSSRVDSEHIPEILGYINEVAQGIGAENYVRDKQLTLLNYKIGAGRCIFVARKTHKEVQLLLKAKTVPEKYHKSLEPVNGFYDRKLIVTELNSTNKTLIKNIIESFNKEDKK